MKKTNHRINWPDITPEDCMPNPAPEEEEGGTLMASRHNAPYDHSLNC